VVKPDDYEMNEVVALMTGALRLDESGKLVDQKVVVRPRSEG
jgi:fructose transport system ATP-binding protein